MKPEPGDKLFAGVQSFCGAAYKWNCCAFCVLKIAERYMGHTYSPITETVQAIHDGFIKYNWDNENDPDNLYVEYPAAWLYKLTGRKWTYEKTYEKPDGVFIIEVWNNLHFRLPDWDSLSYSNSVATGKITSWRILRPV